MPELPEVETTLRGVAPLVVGRRVRGVVVRQRRLRWPVPRALDRDLPGQRIVAAERRAKYLLLRAERGTLIVHLGMSGSLRVVADDLPPAPHEHFDLVLAGGRALRLRDPRRFGAVLWTDGDPHALPLLAHLGPEPLSDRFSGAWLFERSRGRAVAVKSFIMDGEIVVGVGNIYASESLHRAGIRPSRRAGRVSASECDRLAASIRGVLGDAIAAGGTTLRDFTNEVGEPGYFYAQRAVYDRAGEPCGRCGTRVRATRTGQRSTYWCPNCQR